MTQETLAGKEEAHPIEGAIEPNPMRILQIGGDWFSEKAGGAGRYYSELLSSLAELGCDVRGLVVGSDRAERETEGKTLAFARGDAALRVRLWAARRAVASAIRTRRPNLVTSHFALYAFPALDLIRRLPYIVHFHGPWAAEARAEGASRLSVIAKRALEVAVYGRADRYIVLSDAFRRILVEGYGVRDEHVRIVPGGVDATRFAPRETRAEAREALCWPIGRPIILTVRRLRNRMGLDRLIGAMQEVRRRVPEVLLVIAGQGPLRGILKQRSADLRIEANVRFAGFVPDSDLPRVYRAADFVIMPSVELEGFGLTAVEALAAGTPVLVTPVGGLPEVVHDLDPRLVLDGSNAEQIAAGMVSALRGDRRLPDGPRCATFARQHYDWPIIARSVRDVYAELM